jgi:YidC/Oxa1 family membrane protein insertase
MIAIQFFEQPARLLAWFYSLTHSYIISISIMAFLVMLVTAPLVLKSTKGMLEMQKLQPEMKKLQNLHRGDRQKLNEEMMKLYQEHKVNPLASCLPLLLQMPVFIIMFRVLHGLSNRVTCLIPEDPTKKIAAVCGAFTDGRRIFNPAYLDKGSELYKSLTPPGGKNEMLSWGLDLSRTPMSVITESFGKGLIYALLVVALGVLYFAQQKMVASRAAVSPSVSPMQQKLMQYLPVVFAVFLVFYLTGLVIYYMAQAVFRIGLNFYITARFYKHEHSLGRVAQRAGEEAREIAKKDNPGGGGGMFAQAKRELAASKAQPAKAGPSSTVSKRVTPPKNKPTPVAGRSAARPQSTGKAARPNGSGRPPKKK